jgi:hypothetical protein
MGEIEDRFGLHHFLHGMTGEPLSRSRISTRALLTQRRDLYAPSGLSAAVYLY